MESVLVGRLDRRERARLRSAITTVASALLLVNTVWIISRAFISDRWEEVAVPIVIAVAVALPMVAVVAVRSSAVRRFRGFRVDSDGGRLRTADGGVQLPAALRSAIIETAVEQRHPFGGFTWRTGLHLAFRDGSSVRVLLRVDDRIVLVEEERAALRAFLARTDPEVPRPPEDPNGRFAGVRYTGRMTRDEVLRLVERPPGRDDPFPAPV